MSKKNKKTAKSKLSLTEKTGFLVAQRFLNRVLSIFSTVILVRLFSEELYGTFRQLSLLGNLSLVIFVLALPGSLMFFVPRASDLKEKRAFLSQTLIVLGAMGLLALVLLIILSTRISLFFDNPHIVSLMKIYAVLVGLRISITYFIRLMYALERIAITVIFSLFFQIMKLLVLGLSFYLGSDLRQYLFFLVLLEAIKCITAFVLTWITLKGLSFRVNLKTLREQLKFSTPLAASQIVKRLSYDTDLLMVSAFFPTEQFALYSVGAFEFPLVKIIRQASSNVSMARFVSLFRDNRISEFLKLFKDIVRKTTLIVLPCFIFLFVMAEPFISLLYTEKYIGSVHIFRTYLLLIPLSCASFGVLMQAMGKTRPVVKLSLFYMVLNVTMNFILIKIIGLIGPAIATIIGKLYISYAYLKVISKTINRPIAEIYPFIESMWIFIASLMIMIPVMPVTKMISSPFIQLCVASSIFFPACLMVFLRYNILTADDMYHVRKWLNLRWLLKVKQRTQGEG